MSSVASANSNKQHSVSGGAFVSARPLHREGDSQSIDLQNRLNAIALGPTDSNAADRFHHLIQQHFDAAASFEVSFLPSGDPHIGSRFSPQQLRDHTDFREQVLRWSEVARQSKTLQIAKSDGYELNGICVPIVSLGDVKCVWVIVLPRAIGTAQASQTMLIAARYFSLWHDRHAAHTSNEHLESMATILNWVSAIHETDSINGACQSLSSELLKLRGVEFASVALVQKNRIAVCAVAGMTVSRHSDLAASVRAACHDALLHADRSIWPTEDETQQYALLGHRRLATNLQADTVACQCLNDSQGRPHAVICWAGNAAQMPSDRLQTLLSAGAEPLGQAIAAAQHHSRGWIAQAARKTFTAIKSRAGMIASFMIALIVAAMFLPVTYVVRCDCEMQTAARRFAVAPYEGTLRRGYVRVGDVVQAGQLLAEMDDTELSWRLAAAAADHHRARKARDNHLVEDRLPEAFMSALEESSSKMQHRIFQGREAKLQIRSPAAGFILSGDLDQAENAPVEMGDMIYEIGPVSPLRIQLHVPSVDISHVNRDQSVRVWIDGAGWQAVTGCIERVQPESKIIDGQNVFIAEVAIDNHDLRFRPGMRGVARIATAKHALGWNLFHKASEFLMSRLSW